MPHPLSETMPLILYRLAYGHARRLAELDASRRDWARDRTAEVLAEVGRLLGSAEDPSVREGVEDAMAGRKPRW